MKDKSNLTLIAFFAGAGGMDIDFKTIWVNEYDKTITPSYRNYFPDTKIDERSILNV